jgi:hypothetical protein
MSRPAPLLANRRSGPFPQNDAACRSRRLPRINPLSRTAVCKSQSVERAGVGEERGGNAGGTTGGGTRLNVIVHCRVTPIALA